jgi:long-chain-fatty-acid--[acyl-carrier-protein] ligase
MENLTKKNLKKPGGVLFLPNHPAALIDPTIVSLSVWSKFPIRPMIVEYMYFTPGIYSVMKFLNALPIPDFDSSSNSLKRKRNEKVINEVIKGLKSGENFLLYPAGRIKHTAIEDIGGASATQRIIQEAPEANIVLVRTKGLWGSSFSRALTGKVPPLYPTLTKGIKIALKNLLFFTPRRRITIELEFAPPDFPYHASRMELNRWLEKWYNRPDGLTKQEGDFPGDSLVLISYSIWKNEIPEVYKKAKEKALEIPNIKDIPPEIQKKVFAKLGELTESNPTTFKPEMSLAIDLGLDSLDASELAAFLNDQFDVGTVPVSELTTVGHLLAIASKHIVISEEAIEEDKSLIDKWKYLGPHFLAQLPPGETIPEVFLNNCAKMGNLPACADLRSGIVTYSRLKLGVIILAEYIRHLPGKYIGILLPASVGAYMSVLACQLAGKVPLMVNWTIGPRHLKAVTELSKVQIVLTSWAFLEKLDKVDLDGIDDMLVMLESVRRNFSLRDKLRAFFRSKKSTKALLKTFGIDKSSKDEQAVLLFTSGTESMPKGVPLSHHNILSNQRAALEVIEIFSDDCILGILPPFHAYGFSISGLIALLAGVRIAFSPDPTDGKRLAKAFHTWGVTQISGAPTFIKSLIKAARPEEISTMRMCVTGAEKAPPDLFQLMAQIGKEQCVLEGYGITEGAPVLTANRVGKPRKGVGAPLPGVELCIVHPDTHEMLVMGEQGLILARGPNIFSGYINPDVASPFLTINGKEWYNTGDLGYLDSEMRLTISGRKKRFVKAGGEMVSLLAIENALLEAAPKKNWTVQKEGPTLAVLGKDQEGGKPTIKLVATFDTTLDEINQTLRDSGFSNLTKISEIIKLDEIPIMGIGKINYRELEDRYLNKKA